MADSNSTENPPPPATTEQPSTGAQRPPVTPKPNPTFDAATSDGVTSSPHLFKNSGRVVARGHLSGVNQTSDEAALKEPAILNPETVESVRNLIQGELKGAMITDADEVFDYFLSDEHIGFNVSDAFKALTATRPKGERLYQNKAWYGFPDRSGLGCEEKLGLYLERIGKVIDDRFLSKTQRKARKRWSAAFANNCVPDNSCNRKPDLVMVDSTFDDRYQSATTKSVDEFGWWKIQGTIEVKKNMDAYGNALDQLQEYSRLIFRHQPHRRYVISAVILGSNMQLMVFDRSGCLATSLFNIDDEPIKFLRVIIGLLLIDDGRLGLDNTIRFMTRSQGTILVGGESYDFDDVLYVESVIRGRGTACYKITKESETHLVKDSWVDDSRDYKEGQILDFLGDNFAHRQTMGQRAGAEGDGDPDPSGHEGTAEEYPADFDLLRHIPCIVVDEPVEFEGRADSTLALREAHLTVTEGEDGKDIRSWTNPKLKVIEIRQHRRIMIKPVGRKLEDFSCLGELVKGLSHIAKGVVFSLLGYSLELKTFSSIMVNVPTRSLSSRLESSKHIAAELTGKPHGRRLPRIAH